MTSLMMKSSFYFSGMVSTSFGTPRTSLCFAVSMRVEISNPNVWKLLFRSSVICGQKRKASDNHRRLLQSTEQFINKCSVAINFRTRQSDTICMIRRRSLSHRQIYQLVGSAAPYRSNR